MSVGSWRVHWLGTDKEWSLGFSVKPYQGMPFTRPGDTEQLEVVRVLPRSRMLLVTASVGVKDEEPSDKLSLTERDEMLCVIASAHFRGFRLYGSKTRCVCVYCTEARDRGMDLLPSKESTARVFSPPERTLEQQAVDAAVRRMLHEAEALLEQGQSVVLLQDGRELTRIHPVAVGRKS